MPASARRQTLHEEQHQTPDSASPGLDHSLQHTAVRRVPLHLRQRDVVGRQFDRHDGRGEHRTDVTSAVQHPVRERRLLRLRLPTSARRFDRFQRPPGEGTETSPAESPDPDRALGRGGE